MALKTDQDNELARSPNNETVFVQHTEELVDREFYGPPGFRGLFSNHYATLCAAFAAIGGMVFGYDQGVVASYLSCPISWTASPESRNQLRGLDSGKAL